MSVRQKSCGQLETPDYHSLTERCQSCHFTKFIRLNHRREKRNKEANMDGFCWPGSLNALKPQQIRTQLAPKSSVKKNPRSQQDNENNVTIK